MRQITASAVKPGMTIEWSELGIKYTCVVSSIEPACSQISQEIMASGGGEATLYNNTMVTVLAEPQPEEPKAFGAKVIMKGRRFLRAPEGKYDDQPWLEDNERAWCDWNELCEMGQVTVVSDQGWTVPADVPEVPDRIEEWPEYDEHLREHKWCDRDGYRWTWIVADAQWECRDDITDKKTMTAGFPADGPWTRVSDA